MVAVLGLAACYVGWLIDRGWIPHDDGLLAQAAERALQGERPHTDFQDPYTGALTYWNALAMRLFGIRLLSLRLMLLISFLPFLAASYSILRRFLEPRWAALAAAATAVWGLPGYPAAMPTWYNLFFAVLALFAFVRFLESGRHGWLVAAGAAAGVSTLFKLVGVYSLAGLLLALALCAPWIEVRRTERRSRGTRLLVSAGALAYAALLTRLVVGGGVTPAHVFHYLVPGIGLAAGLILFSWMPHPRRSTSATALLRWTLLVTLGFFIPVLVFAAPYAASRTLTDLWEGVVLLPQRRFAFASGAPFPLRRLLPSLPVYLLVLVAFKAPGRWRLTSSAVLMAVLIGALLLGGLDPVFRVTWYAIRALPTILVVAGLLVLATRLGGRGRSDGAPPVLLATAAATLAFLGTFSMVQFPFTGPVYFFYVAPLLPLAGGALVAISGPGARRPAAVILIFITAFHLVWLNHASLLGLGAGRFEPRAEVERLALDRGGIRVTARDKAVYEELVATLKAVTRSPVTFATPDVPEIYFLTGLRNPTPVFYDFFADQERRADRIVRLLDAHSVNVVVLNTALMFSPPPPPALIRALESRYGSARRVGPFIVRWN